MAEIVAYFDESGTQDGAQVISVGGYVATDRQWADFSRDWGCFLAREKIAFMHMTDIENGQGQFRGIRREDKIRIIKLSHELIGASGAHGIGGSVCRKDFESTIKSRPEALAKTGSSYTLSAVAAMHVLADWARRNELKSKITCIFGDLQSTIDGIKVKGELIKLLDDVQLNQTSRELLFIGAHEFRKMQECLPLQAADIHAYELNKYVRRKIGVDSLPHRKSMENLRSLCEHDAGYLDEEAFRALIDTPNHADDCA